MVLVDYHIEIVNGYNFIRYINKIDFIKKGEYSNQDNKILKITY